MSLEVQELLFLIRQLEGKDLKLKILILVLFQFCFKTKQDWSFPQSTETSIAQRLQVLQRRSPRRYLGAKQHCALMTRSLRLYLTKLSHFLCVPNLMKGCSLLHALVFKNPCGKPVSMAAAPLAMFQAMF